MGDSLLNYQPLVCFFYLPKGDQELNLPSGDKKVQSVVSCFLNVLKGRKKSHKERLDQFSQENDHKKAYATIFDMFFLSAYKANQGLYDSLFD